MTIEGWCGFFCASIAVLFFSVVIYCALGKYKWNGVAAKVTAVAGIAVIWFGMHWYYNSTASGTRALIDQRSDFANGLNRTVTVYTANGDIIAQYKGIIDIKDSDGGYVLFDLDGKRYTYYNCFVESIADIQ